LAAEAALDDRLAGEEGEQRVEAGDPEDGGRLVEGGLVEEVFVAVVEARHLADRDHHRDRNRGAEAEFVVAEDGDDEDEGGGGGGGGGVGGGGGAGRALGGGRRADLALGQLLRLGVRPLSPAFPGAGGAAAVAAGPGGAIGGERSGALSTRRARLRRDGMLG